MPGREQGVSIRRNVASLAPIAEETTVFLLPE